MLTKKLLLKLVPITQLELLVKNKFLMNFYLHVMEDELTFLLHSVNVLVHYVENNINNIVLIKKLLIIKSKCISRSSFMHCRCTWLLNKWGPCFQSWGHNQGLWGFGICHWLWSHTSRASSKWQLPVAWKLQLLWAGQIPCHILWLHWQGHGGWL